MFSGGFFALNHQLLKKYLKPVQIKSYHSLAAGTAIYPIAMVALFLGTYSNWFVGAVSLSYMRYAIATVPVVFAVAVFIQTRARFMVSGKGDH